MKEIKTEMQIAASPDKVWEILMNLPEWANWNPIITKIEGELKVGSELSITMADEKGNPGRNYKSTITAIDEHKRFRFIGKMMAKFMFSADRIIELEESPKGTRFTQREVYTGIMVSLFWKKMNTDATRMLRIMNLALKKKVESVK